MDGKECEPIGTAIIEYYQDSNISATKERTLTEYQEDSHTSIVTGSAVSF